MPGQEILSLVGMLVIVAGVLLLAYLFTRYVASKGLMGLTSGAGRRLRVLDQLALGRDQRLVVAQVGERCFLLGAATSGITLLAELTAEEAAQWQEAEKNAGGEALPSFKEAFLAQLKKKK